MRQAVSSLTKFVKPRLRNQPAQQHVVGQRARYTNWSTNMIQGIGGGSGAIGGAGIRFGKHVHAAQASNIETSEESNGQRQLLNIRDTYSGVQDLRKAFELLSDLKPGTTRTSSSATTGTETGTGTSISTQVRSKDYTLAIRSATGVRDIVTET